MDFQLRLEYLSVAKPRLQMQLYHSLQMVELRQVHVRAHTFVSQHLELKDTAECSGATGSGTMFAKKPYCRYDQHSLSA